MNQIYTYVVGNESLLYKSYFSEKQARRKFADLACRFFVEQFQDDPEHIREFGLFVQLLTRLTPEEQEQYAEQLCKNSPLPDMYLFKKTSPINKLWRKNVSNQVDRNSMNRTLCWHCGFFPAHSPVGPCHTSLWDDEAGTVYALIDTSDHPIPPKGVKEIPAFQYFSALEQYKSVCSQGSLSEKEASQLPCTPEM